MIRKIIASIALLVSASCVFAADTTLTDLTTSRLPTGGVYKVTTDETLTTLTVNKITANTQTVATVNATTVSATSITNLNLVVRGTNISASGAFQVGQSSTGSYTTAMGPIILNQPVGIVNSNAVSRYLYFQVLGSTNWYAVPGFQCSAP